MLVGCAGSAVESAACNAGTNSSMTCVVSAAFNALVYNPLHGIDNGTFFLIRLKPVPVHRLPKMALVPPAAFVFSLYCIAFVAGVDRAVDFGKSPNARRDALRQRSAPDEGGAGWAAL